ncbi:MAG: YbaN family protein [Spirochaetaceae bacterium]
MKKVLLIAIGIISLILGIIGIILPVLPTTPFLLLSASCFLNSSTKLYLWLTNHKVFGKYIGSYLKYRAISVKSKIIAILLMSFFMSITIIFFIDKIWLKTVLIIIGLSVSIYLYTRKTLTQEMLESSTEVIP